MSSSLSSDSVLGQGSVLCSSCYRPFRLNNSGRIRRHNNNGMACPGSGSVASHRLLASVSSPGNPSEVVNDQSVVPEIEECSTPILSADLLKRLFGSKVRIIKFVPRGARTQFANTLSKAICDVVSNPDDPSVWMRLLCLPRLCLRKPERGGHGRRITLASIVKQQCSSFLDCKDVMSLCLPQASPPPNTTSTRRQRDNSTLLQRANEKLCSIVSEKLDEGDIRGAVRIACSSDVIAPFDSASFNKLKVKHPPQPCDRREFPPCVSAALRVLQQDVRTAVNSFSLGSAGGASGLRPQHLKDALSRRTGDAGSRLLIRLTDLVNIILSGSVPELVLPVLAGASLTAFNKKDGGIRPIAVGDTLRRLSAKCATKAVQEKFAGVFGPSQLGFGISGGCEAAVHASRRFTNNSKMGDVFLKLDFENAFNSIRRDHVAQCFARHAPELLPFYKMCYEKDSLLFFGSDFMLDSAEGFQQGDPLAVFGFCLGINECIRKIKSRFICAYIDDVSMADHWRVVVNDLISFKSQCESIGLKLNDPKSELCIVREDIPSEEIIREFRSVCPSISITDTTDLTLLGSPIGDNALSAVMEEKLASTSQLCNRVKLLRRHDAFYLLKNCLFMPKLLYMFRTAPTFNVQCLLSSFEQLLRVALENVCNVSFSESSWAQATLPCRLGGLGIPSPTVVAPSAFLASSHSTENLVCALLCVDSLPPDPLSSLARQAWSNLLGHDCSPTDPSKQASWTTPVQVQALKRLLSNSDQLTVSRLQGCSAPGAGDWLNAIPSGSLGLRLNDEQFSVAVGFRLGAPVCVAHKCVCGAEVEPTAQHALSCKKLRSRLSRHSRGNDVILRGLASADLPSTLEPPGLCLSDGKRPDGLTLFPWSRGKSLAWDFTCVNRLAASYSRNATAPGSVIAACAEEKKFKKYSELDRDYITQPVAVESLGGLGPSTLDFLCDLGRRISTISGNKRATEFLRQRIGIAVQAGNAACVKESISFTDPVPRREELI